MPANDPPLAPVMQTDRFKISHETVNGIRPDPAGPSTASLIVAIHRRKIVNHVRDRPKRVVCTRAAVTKHDRQRLNTLASCPEFDAVDLYVIFNCFRH